MEIVLTDQYSELLLLVNGLAILFYIGARKKKKQRAMKFGNYKTLQKVAGKNFLKSANVLLLIKLAALTSLVLGLSGPALVEEVPSTRSDYILAIDSSSSMLASDIEPTRFRAAKDISKDFVERLSNSTRIGVISFAGQVKGETSPTSEHENVRHSIENIEMGQTAGTAIGEAIYAGTSQLIDSEKNRRIILLTDGRNNVGTSLNESIQYASSHNVTVTAIAIGSTESGGEGYEEVQGVNASRARFPNLNTERLNSTVRKTGGKLVTVTDRSELKTAFLDFEDSETRNDLSTYFLLFALFLILTEWVLGNTRYSILP